MFLGVKNNAMEQKRSTGFKRNTVNETGVQNNLIDFSLLNHLYWIFLIEIISSK